MSEPKGQSLVFNYADIFFSYYFSEDLKCTKMVRDHHLVYVYSGEFRAEEDGKKVVLRAGECAFLRRDNRVNMEKVSTADEPFRGIFMLFKRPFLREMYQKSGRTDSPAHIKRHKKSVIKLPQTPDITGLFLSMTPYFDSSIRPTEEMMNLKQVEGVYSLLNIDERFNPTLFDFTEPWKIDILEFMEANYMYELSMEEIASFTGRSLSTFKRDFKKISELSPQKWLIRRRLRAAYEKIKEDGMRVTEVYSEVGFKNLSHFSSAFKREYGFSPGK